LRIAIAGKGGSGKTTIAGTLCRVLARRGRAVRAIDGDSNPNLGVALGLDPVVAEGVEGLPHEVVRVVEDPLEGRRLEVVTPTDEIFERYGVEAPDGIRLVVASRIAHAGKG
jgi:CO dehydrogenase maturation factor